MLLLLLRHHLLNWAIRLLRGRGPRRQAVLQSEAEGLVFIKLEIIGYEPDWSLWNASSLLLRKLGSLLVFASYIFRATGSQSSLLHWDTWTSSAPGRTLLVVLQPLTKLSRSILKLDNNPWVPPIEDQLMLGVSHVIEYIRTGNILVICAACVELHF